MHKPTDWFCVNQRVRSGSNHSLPMHRKNTVGDLNINHSLLDFSMLVQCPSCDEELDVDLDQGLFFECPTCGSDFEVDSPHSSDVEYSEHHWRLVLESEIFYEEKLAYIQSNDGEIPDDRLITFEIYNGNFAWGYVVWSFFFLGIPLLLFAMVHIVSNLKRSHKLFFWIDNRYRKFYDPVEEVIITVKKFHSGWHPTSLLFVRNDTLHIIKEVTSDEYPGYRYKISVNDKQAISFGNRDDANRFVSMVYEHR